MSCISNYFIVLSKTPLDCHLLSYNESLFHHFCGKNLSWASNPFLCLFGVWGYGGEVGFQAGITKLKVG